MENPHHRTQPPSLNFEIPPGEDAVYSNLVRISHTPAELVFDFAAMLPGQTAAKVVSRLVMSPMGAKMFLRALAENLGRYETTFGEISLPPDNSLASELFRPNRPPEPPKPD